MSGLFEEPFNAAWIPLKEFGTLVRGNGLTKVDLQDSGVPAIHYGQIHARYGMSTDKTISFVSSEKGAELKQVDKGDVVMAVTSEDMAGVCKALFYNGNEQAVTGAHATVLKPKKFNLGKYFTYYTQTAIFSNEKLKYANGTKVFDISSANLANMLVPIPFASDPEKSHKTQARIIAILDLLYDVWNELSRQLYLRKLQYEYYRDYLIGYGDKNIPRLKLSQVAAYSKEKINFSQLNEDNYVGNENLLRDKAGKTKSSYVPQKGRHTKFAKNDILIGNIAPYLKKIWIADEDGGASNDVLVLTAHDEKDARYLFHALSSDIFFEYDKSYSRGNRNRGDKLKIMQFEVPYPPDSDKRMAISDKLDKFEAYTNTVAGLPGELEKRKLQFEHYRDAIFNKLARIADFKG